MGVTIYIRVGHIFSWLLAAVLVNAAAAIELPADYRNTIEQGIANGSYSSVAVGLIRNNERNKSFFGANRGAESASEIGSVSMVFTGLLLCEAARAGKLKFDDPIVKFLPADFKFADARVAAITLEELATHRSGLPRLPANLMPLDVDDPYADYDETALLAWLAHYHPNALDKRYEYSNLGSGLLGYLLGRAYGTDYPRALTEHILHPLQLEHTGFADENSVDGHNDGNPAKPWHFRVLAGAGGLHSTLDDLLSFAQLNLQPGDHPLRAALLLARQPHGSIVGGSVGLGWHIMDVTGVDQTWPLIWHNGVTGGFSSFVGFRVDQQRAVVLLGNASTDLTGLGMALLNELPAPAPPNKPIVLSPEQLSEFTGLYQILPGSELTLRIKRGQLEAQLSGQAGLPLYAAHADAFFYRAIEADIRFVRMDGKINGLVLHQDGKYFSAKRLSSRPPTLERQPIKVAATELIEFNGDYQLDADTQIRVMQYGDQLRFQLTARAAEALLAYAKDHFAAETDGTTLVFTRNGKSEVSGLTLTLGDTEHSATRINWQVH